MIHARDRTIDSEPALRNDADQSERRDRDDEGLRPLHRERDSPRRYLSLPGGERQGEERGEKIQGPSVDRGASRACASCTRGREKTLLLLTRRESARL